MSSNVKAKPQTFSSSGLYGTATTNKNGTTYNPSNFEKQLVGMTTQYIPQYLQQLVNPTYDSEVFKAQTTQRNRLANQSFENNLINPLSHRGLTRGSSVNQMSNRFANKLADLETDAMANEDTRNANMLNNLFNYYQVPYGIMMGMSDFSNQQYQSAVQNALKQNELNNKALKTWATSLGNMSGFGAGQGDKSSGMGWGGLLGTGLGYALGGPAGASVGSLFGNQLGNLWK